MDGGDLNTWGAGRILCRVGLAGEIGPGNFGQGGPIYKPTL